MIKKYIIWIVLIFLITISWNKSFAQNIDPSNTTGESKNDNMIDEPFVYKFVHDFPLNEFDLVNKKVIENIEIAGQDYKFVDCGEYSIQLKNSAGNDETRKVHIIKFWYFGTTEDAYKIYNVNLQNEQKYFFIDNNDFNNPDIVAKEYEILQKNWTIIGGTLILPVKFRFATDETAFDFSKDITIGLSVGVKFRLFSNKSIYVSNIFSVGITSVSVDSINTQGYFKESNNQAALTFSFGCLLQLNKFQVGAFFGIDKLGGEVSKKWIFQKKPWFSLGIGYQILGSGN